MSDSPKKTAQRYCPACWCPWDQHRGPIALCTELEQTKADLKAAREELETLRPLAEPARQEAFAQRIRQAAAKANPQPRAEDQGKG